MAKKQTRTTKKADSKSEYQRFLETAKEVGASDDPKDFDRAVKKVAPLKGKAR